MRDECDHGSLRRSCQICDRDQDIADMRKRIAELENALSLVKQWDVEQATETFMKSGKPMQFQLPRAVREQIQTLLQEES